MDWSHYAESLWRYSVPLEVVPDVSAWLVCGAMAVWLVRFVVFRRPRLCAISIFGWLAWLTWQATCVSGVQAVYGAKRRALAALEATDHFAHHLLGLVKAWTDFFLPFMSDVCRWALRLYKKMTLRQRIIVFFVALGGYAVLQAVRMFRRHASFIKHVLFHLSFLIGGPLLWYSSGKLSTDVLFSVVTHMITTIPAIVSFLVLSYASDPKGYDPRRRNSSDSYEQSVIPTTNVKMHRLWLSYWACWPALAVFEAGVGMVPKLIDDGSLSLQMELQRALLTFVVWLQLWQGSRLLHYTMQSMLFNTSILEYLARFFGARGLWMLNIVRGGVWAGVSPTGGMRMFGILRQLTSKLWLSCLGLAAVLGVMFILVTLFYRAVATLSSLATMLLWLCAATDSADTLTNHAEEFYTKKLSFWVLAMAWEASTKLPYVGVILRLFTPIAFSFWLLVGEHVLRRVLLPLFRLVATPVKMILSAIFSVIRPSCGRRSTADKQEELSDNVAEGDTDDEVEEEEEEASSTGEPIADTGKIGNEESDMHNVSATGSIGGLEDDTVAEDGADTGGTDAGELRERKKDKHKTSKD